MAALKTITFRKTQTLLLVLSTFQNAPSAALKISRD